MSDKVQEYNVDIAVKEGIEAACLYGFIERMYYDNRALGHGHYKGKYWVDLPLCSYTYFLPFLKGRQILLLLDKLVEDGLLERSDRVFFGEPGYTIKEKA